MKHTIWLLLLAHIFFVAGAQERSEETVVLKTSTGDIMGSLITASKEKHPVALIIGGSGPTDRNGNNPAMKNNSLRQLATALAANGISSLRYDKRGIAESKAAAKDEASLRFEDYVADAREWINWLKQKKEFSRVVVIGHSEGSLIGMIAGQPLADQFVSIAGPGRPADEILKEQLKAQPQMIRDLCFPIIDSLKQGKMVENVNPLLNSLFRSSVQPYLISWFRYDPRTALKKLDLPILIIQGTNDLQVTLEDAQMLKRAADKTSLELVEGMNHVLKIIDNGDKQANLASYNNPELPISEKLVQSVLDFILAQSRN